MKIRRLFSSSLTVRIFDEVWFQNGQILMGSDTTECLWVELGIYYSILVRYYDLSFTYLANASHTWLMFVSCVYSDVFVNSICFFETQWVMTIKILFMDYKKLEPLKYRDPKFMPYFFLMFLIDSLKN